jgi:hypothetical protein
MHNLKPKMQELIPKVRGNMMSKKKYGRGEVLRLEGLADVPWVRFWVVFRFINLDQIWSPDFWNIHKQSYYDGVHRTTMLGHKFQANLQNSGNKSDPIVLRWKPPFHDGSLWDIVPRWELNVPRWKKPKSIKKPINRVIIHLIQHTIQKHNTRCSRRARSNIQGSKREFEISRKGLPSTIGVPLLARPKLIFNVIF